MEGEPQFQRPSEELSPRASLIPGPVGVGLLACAAVALAHWLGAAGFSATLLGFPLGVWLVGACVGVAYLRQRRAHHGAVPGVAAAEWKRHAKRLVREFTRQADGLLHDDLSSAFSRLVNLPLRGLQRLLTDRGRQAGISRPRIVAEARARVGVTGPPAEIRALLTCVEQEMGLVARFEPVAAPVRTPEECARRGLAAAVVIPEMEAAMLVLPERGGREAAWEDWSRRLSLGYAATFPARVDAATISCGRVDAGAAREVRLLVRLADAGAALAQIDARTGTRVNAEQRAGRIVKTMMALAQTLATDWADAGETHAQAAHMCRAAARGVSAWLSTCTDIDPQGRRGWTEACARVIAEEPEAHLRLGAALIGAYEDDAGIAALERGFELLRHSGELPMSDPLAFVSGELELGVFDAQALGRVAAGVTLAWATMPHDSLACLRDDLAEDLRFAGKLVGRDQDHALLKRVIAHMHRLRADTLPLRYRAAA